MTDQEIKALPGVEIIASKTDRTLIPGIFAVGIGGLAGCIILLFGVVAGFTVHTLWRGGIALVVIAVGIVLIIVHARREKILIWADGENLYTRAGQAYPLREITKIESEIYAGSNSRSREGATDDKGNLRFLCAGEPVLLEEIGYPGSAKIRLQNHIRRVTGRADEEQLFD